MGLKPDHWIRRMALEHRMIEPFEDRQIRNGVISFGVSSYGYDIRVANEFKIFTNVHSAIVDPKHFDTKSMVDFTGEVCIIPPNSFALARTIEYFRIPRKVLTVCLGKCLIGDTRVVDSETGDYLPLEQFVREKRSSTSSLSEWRLKPHTVERHLQNGIMPVFELRTKAGLKIKATASHPFRAWEGWLPLEALRPGDRIAVARSCPVFGTEEWNEHEAILLGLLLADGQCHTPGSSPRFTTSDPRIAETLAAAVRGMGGDAVPVGRFGYNLVNRKGRGGIMKRNRFSAWLEELGCNVHSANKFIPGLVFRARRERVIEFLRALFSGDGSVYDQGEAVFLEYSSSSERLAYDVRHLLLRFGIFALVREKTLKAGGKAYRVQITDRDQIRSFGEQIGFIPGSQKQGRLEALIPELRSKPAHKSNFDTLPGEVWQMMSQTAQTLRISLRKAGIPGSNPSQSLPDKTAQKITQLAPTSEFADIVESDVVWDTVESIEPVGEAEVYDLNVPGSHNFLANDLIVHNSTYARCGIIVNVTPFEPEWEGFVTLEISNTTPLPAKIYANEGIAQVLFFEADEECEVSYADKKGKYQNQQSIVLPKL